MCFHPCTYMGYPFPSNLICDFILVECYYSISMSFALFSDKAFFDYLVAFTSISFWYRNSQTHHFQIICAPSIPHTHCRGTLHVDLYPCKWPFLWNSRPLEPCLCPCAWRCQGPAGLWVALSSSYPSRTDFPSGRDTQDRGTFWCSPCWSQPACHHHSGYMYLQVLHICHMNRKILINNHYKLKFF